MTLKFSFYNSKIHKLAKHLGLPINSVIAFDLPAGHTCPMADKCKATANKITGRITDGKNMQFRCYAASTEVVFPSARQNRWHNFEELKKSTNMSGLIEESLPRDVKVVRIHSSGDFFNEKYFEAWCKVAKNHPEINFFGYTKVLPYVKANKPDNFKLVYSYGGKLDDKLENEPVSYVVNSMQDAINKGLPVSCQSDPADDYDYIMSQKSFALVIHGMQPKKNKKNE